MDQARAILQQLGINQTIFIMIGVFLGTMLLVSLIALNYLSKVLVEREHRTLGRKGESDHIAAELTEIREKLDSQTKKAQIEAAHSFQEWRVQAGEKQRDVVFAARTKATDEVQSARQKIQTQVQGEIAKLQSEIPALAKAIVEKLAHATGGKLGFGSDEPRA